MSDKSITCVLLFGGKFIVGEYKMEYLLPSIKIPKPIDLVWAPSTYPSDFNTIKEISFEYVGKLPDGRYLYALDEK